MTVLLVTADAVRKDRLSWYGYERDTSPFLADLAERSLVFRNAYSVSCHTREAIPPILTGEMPADCLRRYKITSQTLPQVLRERGHVTTAGVTSGPFLGRANNYHRGFDRFENCYRWDRNSLAMSLEYLSDIVRNDHFVSGYDVNDRVVERLDRDNDTETFVWAHYMDVHAPYNRFSEWHWGKPVSDRRIQYVFRKAKYAPSLLPREEIDLLNDCYDNSLREFDRIMRDLFERIDDDTRILLTSDHGESLGDNGVFAHKRQLLDELLEVSMLIRDGESGDISYPVSTLDIAPTIADWFDVEFDGAGMPLRSSTTRRIEATCLNTVRRKRRQIQ